MPYTSYAKMSAEDMRALYDYLMKEVPAQNGTTAPATSAGRCRCAGRWRCGTSCSTTTSRIRQIRNKAPEWNRGAYLVRGAGHCGQLLHAARLGDGGEGAGRQGRCSLSGAELGRLVRLQSACGLPPEEATALPPDERGDHSTSTPI